MPGDPALAVATGPAAAYAPGASFCASNAIAMTTARIATPATGAPADDAGTATLSIDAPIAQCSAGASAASPNPAASLLRFLATTTTAPALQRPSLALPMAVLKRAGAGRGTSRALRMVQSANSVGGTAGMAAQLAASAAARQLAAARALSGLPPVAPPGARKRTAFPT